MKHGRTERMTNRRRKGMDRRMMEREGRMEGWMGRKEKWMGRGRERRMDTRTDRSKEEETRKTGKTEGRRDQGWKEGRTRG